MGRRTLLVVAAASVLVLAACNKNSSSSTTEEGGAGSSSTSGTGQVSTAQVSGVGTVLVNPAGFALYHLKTESENNITCTGPCAQTWPPYLVNGTMPTAGSGVTGNLSEISRPDGGEQLTYNGLPLYTYTGDKSPGQATGNGIQNVWFAVTPDMKAAGGGGGNGGGGGYGYGS